MRLVCVAVLACACGGHDSASIPQRLVFERWSPPQPTSYDLFLAARGNIVVLAHRFSRDGGASWEALPAELGAPMRLAITDRAIVTYASGLVRWDVASGAIVHVAGAPAYATDRTWRVDPTGRF